MKSRSIRCMRFNNKKISCFVSSRISFSSLSAANGKEKFLKAKKVLSRVRKASFLLLEPTHPPCQSKAEDTNFITFRRRRSCLIRSQREANCLTNRMASRQEGNFLIRAFLPSFFRGRLEKLNLVGLLAFKRSQANNFSKFLFKSRIFLVFFSFLNSF